MKTVQPAIANQPSLTFRSIAIRRHSLRTKMVQMTSALMLSGVFVTLAAQSTLAQLPSLEPANTPTREALLPDGSTNSGPSTVALETYALGPGDQVRIDVLVDHEIFRNSIDQIVLLDGSLTLPWIGKVDVTGLNPIEAEAKVVNAYSRYIRNPKITFQLLQPRPLRVGVVGEVKRPGGYTLQVNSAAGEQSESSEGRTRFWPSLTQAISNAGGITRSANVRSVQISREGLSEPIEVNLWNLVETGDLRQDILLRDGDQIIVPTAEVVDNTDLITLATTTFAPTSIRVNVIGEVQAPGRLEVPPNTLLNQAVMTAGGFNKRARKSRVKLIRLNPNGNVTESSIDIDLAQGVSNEQNPVLQDGDTIIVSRSGIAATSDAAGLIFSPLTNLFLSVFGIQ